MKMVWTLIRCGRLIALAATMLCAGAGAALADDPQPPLASNGLAQTPPMGWNSWNKFGCNVNEQLIRATADAIAASGMKDAGYAYVVIDDCWQGARDERGDIQPDAVRFPSGIKALADYVHARGLKFGLYSDAGLKTCAGRPGSRGYEYQDARQYAAWGVDYLKYDWCMAGTQDAPSSYYIMGAALRASGRPIVFSICEWGNHAPWNWGASVGNLWRTTGDIHDAWQGASGYSLGMLDILDKQVDLWAHAGPGGWNDPDMLEVGNGGMTDDEYRAHFSLWAMLAAPLIAGNDVVNMDAATKAILTNAAVIAVDQDPLGQQGRRISKDGDLEVWARPLANGGRAVVLLNRGTTAATISVDWLKLHYPARLRARVTDLWTGERTRARRNGFSAPVRPHAAVMIRIDPAV